MPRVSYTAPTTIDDAVKALAASAGLAKVLSGGTDLLVQLKSGRVRPELIVDTKRIPGIIGIREEGDKFVIGAATPGVMISADERLTQAYPGIVEGRRSDRLDPDPGPRLDRRQSVQRLAGRRQRAAGHRRARHGGRRRPQRPARGAGREHRHRPRPDLAAKGRARRRVPHAEAEVAPVRRLSALHPAHRDGHRRRRLRRQRDLGRRRHLHRCAGRARRRRADPSSSSTEAAQALIGHKLDDDTLKRLDAAAQRRLQADRRQARHDRVPHQGRRRAGAPRGRHRFRTRRGARLKPNFGRLKNEQASRIHHHQRRAGGVSLRGAADAARRACATNWA